MEKKGAKQQEQEEEKKELIKTIESGVSGLTLD